LSVRAHHKAHYNTAGPNARPHYHVGNYEGAPHLFYELLLLLDFSDNGELDSEDAVEGADTVFPGPLFLLDLIRSTPPGAAL